MKHSELRHQPRHVNPRIQVEMKYLGIIAAQDASGQLIEPDVPDDQSKLFDLKDWNFRYVPLRSAFVVVDGEV